MNVSCQTFEGVGACLCECDQGVPEKEHCSQRTPSNKQVFKKHQISYVVEQVSLNQTLFKGLFGVY